MQGGDIAEEARVDCDTTLFIDYVGVDPQGSVPLLIVEAKAWDKPFVSARRGRQKANPEELITLAIDHISQGGDSSTSPVSSLWQ